MNEQLSLFVEGKQFLWQFHGKVLASEWRDSPPIRTHRVVHVIADFGKAPSREAALLKFKSYFPEAKHIELVCLGEAKPK